MAMAVIYDKRLKRCPFCGERARCHEYEPRPGEQFFNIGCDTPGCLMAIANQMSACPVNQFDRELAKWNCRPSKKKGGIVTVALFVDGPECPHCGLIHEMPEKGEYHTINCDCGWKFEAQRTEIVISRPLENRR